MIGPNDSQPRQPRRRTSPQQMPLACDLDTAVPDWIIEYPVTLAIFKKHGIDYCCGGKSLEYACQDRGLDAYTVLAELRQSVANGSIA